MPKPESLLCSFILWYFFLDFSIISLTYYMIYLCIMYLFMFISHHMLHEIKDLISSVLFIDNKQLIQSLVHNIHSDIIY